MVRHSIIKYHVLYGGAAGAGRSGTYHSGEEAAGREHHVAKECLCPDENEFPGKKQSAEEGFYSYQGFQSGLRRGRYGTPCEIRCWYREEYYRRQEEITEVTVDFDKVGVKKMFAGFAKLKKI